MTRQSARISLLGGLGNQLFQLAAVMSVDSKDRQLDASFVSVRRTDNVEDIFYFVLPSGVSRVAKIEPFLFLQKGFNFALRFSLSKKISWLKGTIRWILNLVANLTLREPFALQIGSNLGYVPIVQRRDKNLYLHGYFQSYQYLQSRDVLKQLMEMKLASDHDELSKYRQLAETTHPLVVHVRRGDYKTESNFGLLGPKYYESAIDLMWSTNAFKEIWLFSDEADAALELIPSRYQSHVRVIPDIDGIPATTLEIMRLGSGYVIANSSFSWWGAALSKNSKAMVVSPDKWFKAMNDPLDLIPPNWTQLPSDFL